MSAVEINKILSPALELEQTHSCKEIHKLEVQVPPASSMLSIPTRIPR